LHSEHWSIFAIKELIDNGLDDAEQTGVAPEITITVNPAWHTISAADNGSGIPPDVVARLLDFRTKTSSREAYVAPTRGQQGNALQTILAMPFALDGTYWRSFWVGPRGSCRPGSRSAI
jgi:DNA topoisomerase VI subunit B